MLDLGNVNIGVMGCFRYRIIEILNIWDANCLRCGMFAIRMLVI